MKTIAPAAVAMVLFGGAGVLAGCSSIPTAPTYTEEELEAICERQGSGWWHHDSLTGGFCEPIHS